MNTLTKPLSDGCIDQFETLVDTIFSFSKSSTYGAKSSIFKFFNTLYRILLFLIIFPAIPFYIVMAFALSSIKYMVLKLRTL